MFSWVTLRSISVVLCGCLQRTDCRADGYRWQSSGTQDILKKEVDGVFKRRLEFAQIKLPTGELEADRRFKRYQFWRTDLPRYMIIVYIGDASIAHPFSHGNANKSSQNYCMSKASVKEDIQFFPLNKTDEPVYNELICRSSGGPLECVAAPLNKEQVRNFRKKQKAEQNLSITKDEFLNTHLLAQHLYIADQRFVRFYASVPDILLYCLSEDLLQQVNHCVELTGSDNAVVFHYDTCFDLGKFFLSTISMRHPLLRCVLCGC